MHLLDLPNEILSSLPLYIDNIETFTNAASSCRRLRENFAQTHPKTILLLANASAPTFFSPHPHYLITATARQASDWAIGNKENTRRLRKAFQGGIDSFYDFCINNPNTGLRMQDIRRLHQARFSIINRLADQIDKMAGDQWYSSVDNFWDGGVSEAETLQTESNLAALQIIIYGELFASSMQAFLESENELLPSFDIETRLDYIKYCIPDWACRSYRGMEVLPVGPYAPGVQVEGGNQVPIRHILQCSRWRRMWARAIRVVDRNFEKADQEKVGDGDVDPYGEEPWSQRLCRTALQTQGLEGMQLVTLPEERVSKECRDQSLKIKQQVENVILQGKFDDATGANMQKIRVPDLAREVAVCMASYYPESDFSI